MTPLRFLCLLAAAALAGTPTGGAAQVTPPNPFATSLPRHESRLDSHGWRHHRRMELRGGRLERRGERWQRRGERWERHGARLHRHGRVHAGREWTLRGNRLEHRGSRLEHRGMRLHHRGDRLERRHPGFERRGTLHDRDRVRQRARLHHRQRPGYADGWL